MARTTLLIDNRATAKVPYEHYVIDRAYYPTYEDLVEMVKDNMNSDVYKITVYEDDVEIISMLNTVA